MMPTVVTKLIEIFFSDQVKTLIRIWIDLSCVHFPQVYVKKNILKIPAHVLLPEDKV